MIHGMPSAAGSAKHATGSCCGLVPSCSLLATCTALMLHLSSFPNPFLISVFFVASGAAGCPCRLDPAWWRAQSSGLWTQRWVVLRLYLAGDLHLIPSRCLLHVADACFSPACVLKYAHTQRS